MVRALFSGIQNYRRARGKKVAEGKVGKGEVAQVAQVTQVAKVKARAKTTDPLLPKEGRNGAQIKNKSMCPGLRILSLGRRFRRGLGGRGGEVWRP